jgi:hypothetical protein
MAGILMRPMVPLLSRRSCPEYPETVREGSACGSRSWAPTEAPPKSWRLYVCASRSFAARPAGLSTTVSAVYWSMLVDCA